MFRHFILKPSLLTLLCLLLAWGAVPVRAATITATNESQLSNAIISASSGDTINITRSFTLTSNLPNITVDLTINGNGATISGGTDIRIFTVDGFTNPVSVTINKLKMIGGNCGGACPISSSSGGGLYNDSGMVTINNSTFSNNSVSDAGGGLYTNNGTMTINNSTFSGNSADYAAGGFYNSAGWVTINNSTFSGNHADYGGGIYNGGTLTINNSIMSGNTATTLGGGIASTWDITINNSTLSGNSAPQSGGVDNNGTTLTINYSTVSGNSATTGNGGGIYNYTSGTVILTNSTFSGNSALSGGGLANLDGTVTLTHSTFSSNTATTSGGGIYNDSSGTVTLNNSLLGKGAQGANCDGTGTINGNGAAYNLSDDGSCGANVTQVASLGVGTLGANGGSTQTIPLVVGSPAIDAALAADCPAADQRGTARPIGADCDIGAFEGILLPPQNSVVPTSAPAPALCSQTGFTPSTQVAVSLPNGGSGMNQCYSLLTDPAQVGVTQPFTLAVEVYSFDASGSVTFGAPVQVCLQGAGTLLYRDASGQPRVTVSLPSFTKDGLTCGIIPNAGTVILIPGAPAPTAAIPPTALSNCRVTTTNILNLRAEPDANSAVLTKVPYQTTLSASARSGEWLQVVFGGQQGWVSASYLSLTGDCG